ncbi:MAG: glycosyltransferase family 4 protein, partial [Gammaproteobacteria bacterium]
MKRVLILSRDTAWFGGVVNFITSLNKNLSSDFEVVQFQIGRRKGRLGLLLRPLVPLLDAFRLAFLVNRKCFDAYHLNPSLNYSSLLRDGLFMLLLRLVRADNVIVSFHGWEAPVEQKIANNRMLLAVFKYIFSYADHTLVLAEAFRDWLVTVVGFDRVRVQIFTTMFDDAEFRGVQDVLSHDDTRVLFLSRLVREKGIYELIDGFRALVSDYPEIKLVIAGNGPEEERLRDYVMEAGIGDRVTFTGYVRGADKVRVLKAAGLFVFPTYYGEGCPIALLEAMA